MNSLRKTGLAHPETLEPRQLLTGVPFGASSQDTGEFMLGEVSVNVVFLESNGAIDADTEQWTPQLAAGVKANIEAGVQWWVDLLALHSDVHTLSFDINYQYADNPVEISYEPISRPSQHFTLWIEEFYRAVGVPQAGGFSTEIRQFNHNQRVADDTNWAFTIFVVNADNDPNDQFGDANGNGTQFRRAFAYSGGQFIVMPHSRPASTVAHEIGHMFWAFDEYDGSHHYTARRGYYRTQNTNSAFGHPNPSSREPSIMASRGGPFENYQISQSARETIGWRDSDGDGIFDVLDVDHSLSGDILLDESTQTVRLVGASSVQTLNNLNTEGTGNAMTLNRITGLQYRVDSGAWLDLQNYDDYQVTIDAVSPVLPTDFEVVEFRTIDHRVGVTSNVLTLDLNAPQQNPLNALDVNNDGFVSPIDVLRIVITLNGGENGDGVHYLDVSGDSFVTALDALIVINYINSNVARAAGAEPPLPAPQAEPVEAAFAGQAVPEEHVIFVCDGLAVVDSDWLDDDEDEELLDAIATGIV